MIKPLNMVSCLLFGLSIVFSGTITYGETYISGNIATDTIWSKSNSPYIITGVVQVYPNVTLTIEPGVAIKFNSMAGLKIGGEVVARGTDNDPILFTANTTAPWGNIEFAKGSIGAVFDVQGNYLSGSVLENCIFDGGQIITKDTTCNLYISKNVFNYSDINMDLYYDPNHAFSGDTLVIIKDNFIENGNINIGLFSVKSPPTPWVFGIKILNNRVFGAISVSTCGTNYVNIIQNHSAVGIYRGPHYFVNSYVGICGTEPEGPTLIDSNVIDGCENPHHSYGTWALHLQNQQAFVSNNIIHGPVVLRGRPDWVQYVSSESSVTIEDNLISSNVCAVNGVGIQAESRPTITSAIIQRNKIYGGTGISLSSGMSGSIKNNTITGNWTGILSPLNSNVTIEENIIKGNHRGITIIDGRNLIIKSNDIFANSEYDIYNDSSSEIYVPNNWWGTTDIGIISQHIFDYYDDFTKGKVSYLPVASSPFFKWDEIMGTGGAWSSGIWYYNLDTMTWSKPFGSTPSGPIAVGDVTGDGKADMVSCWPSGLWYQDGVTLGWTKVWSVAPSQVAVGDITGDGRTEIIGTWVTGIWYWNPATSLWTKMTSYVPSGPIAAGDVTGDGRADVVSCWPSGLWYQNGATLAWTKVSSVAPSQVAVGDITGDGQAEIIGTWGSGIWYWNPATSGWTKMYSSVPSGPIAAGDVTGDGRADVVSVWPSGLWYQDGATLGWTKVYSTAPSKIAVGDITGD